MHEYVTREKLAKIGYRFEGENLDCEKAEIFSAIADEIAKLREEDAKRSSKRGNRS